MTANWVDSDLFSYSSSTCSNLDSLSESLGSSAGSTGSFFQCLDREDRKRERREQPSAPMPPVTSSEQKEPKSVWMQICEKHKGEWVDVTVRLPDPCPQCQQKDGHGQKARIFSLPDQKMGSFDTQFAKQQEMKSHKLKNLISFNK